MVRVLTGGQHRGVVIGMSGVGKRTWLRNIMSDSGEYSIMNRISWNIVNLNVSHRRTRGYHEFDVLLMCYESGNIDSYYMIKNEIRRYKREGGNGLVIMCCLKSDEEVSDDCYMYNPRFDDFVEEDYDEYDHFRVSLYSGSSGRNHDIINCIEHTFYGISYEENILRFNNNNVRTISDSDDNESFNE